MWAKAFGSDDSSPSARSRTRLQYPGSDAFFKTLGRPLSVKVVVAMFSDHRKDHVWWYRGKLLRCPGGDGPGCVEDVAAFERFPESKRGGNFEVVDASLSGSDAVVSSRRVALVGHSRTTEDGSLRT